MPTIKPTKAKPARRAARPAAAGRAAPAAKRSGKATPPARARRTRLASRPLLAPLRDASPAQLDVLALAVVLVAVFLGGVAYFGWAGGALGRAALNLLKTLFGVLAYVVPVALAVLGVRLLARESWPARRHRPLRTGTICLCLGIALTLAAGTLGIGPGRTPHGAAFATATVRARGGLLGGLEYWLADRLVSPMGASLLAIFLVLVGSLLISGATVGSLVRASRLQARRALRFAEVGESATARAEVQARRLRDSARLREEPPADELALPGDGEFHVRDERPLSAADAVVDLAPEPEYELPGDPDIDPHGNPASANVLDLYEDADGQRSFGLDGGERASAPAGADAPAATHAPADGEPSEESVVAGDQRRAGPQREVEASELTPAGRYRPAVLEDPEFVWKMPSSRFLVRSSGEAAKPDTAGQARTAKALVEGLANFGVESKVIGQVSGPHITRYELRLAPGVKMSKVANLKDDLAYALAATDIRILAPIPGKTAVGVEVPNARRRIVHLGDVYQPPPEGSSPLTVWLGKDISGRGIAADLTKMPHLLVAGTTGAGKSACVNAMLCSVLLHANPHEVRLVLVDPKQVELNHYDSLPHLLTPVITSPRMAANALANLVKEMEDRYGTMSLARTRSLPELNKVRAGRGQAPLPYILCVIDELADLMMVAPADVEDAIIRLAQKARAVGIHLVLATQSPRVDVITGMIKANVPSRIAFAVSSQTDSRVILDQGGAESLLGQGDMLFSPVGSNRLQRIQGAYIDEEQIAALTDQWCRQGEPEFREELLEEVASDDAGEQGVGGEDALDPDEDPLLQEAISLVAQMGTASTSMLQRRLRLGYTRAGRLIDMLERRGIISGYEGSKPRQVLISEGDVPRILVALSKGSGGGDRSADQVAADSHDALEAGPHDAPDAGPPAAEQGYGGSGS